jgi:predicted methyltransferase
MKNFIGIMCALLMSLSAAADADRLQAAIDGKHRTPASVDRDVYRNPGKTLQLFDVQPGHTVVEIWPGGGWYTEILAPYLKNEGLLIAAHFDSKDEQATYRPGSRANFDAKMAANPKVYGKVSVSSLMFDEKTGSLVKGAAKSNSVDRVVTFRNAHGWYADGTLNAAFTHFYDILKPGGKFGIVQHMADQEQDWMSRNIGYMSREFIISAAAKVGFVLEAEGYFNRNPLDNKRYPKGVWQLPPSLRDLSSDTDKAPYLSIGESDRMTLVFIKR